MAEDLDAGVEQRRVVVAAGRRRTARLFGLAGTNRRTRTPRRAARSMRAIIALSVT